MIDTRIEREREHWDEQARFQQSRLDEHRLRVEPDDLYDKTMPWLPYMGIPALTSSLLEYIGPLNGKRILDIGTGTGFLAVMLAVRGAEVVAVDVSGESLHLAQRRAELSQVASLVEFQEMPGELLAFPDEHFDMVVGSFVLHHSDLNQSLAEIKRVLKPGGRSAFIETWGGSPPLMLARTLVPGRMGVEKCSSDDEKPLGKKEAELVRHFFPESYRFIFPELLFMRMLAVIPLLKWNPIYQFLNALDRLLYIAPPLRSWSYFALVAFTKPCQAR